MIKHQKAADASTRVCSGLAARTAHCMTTGHWIDEPPEGGFTRPLDSSGRAEPGAQPGDQESRRRRGLLTSLTIPSPAL
jgi:hypothetical protein